MKILLYSINYAPELTGIGKYNSELASWLAGRGHQVLVVTAPPYYPEWRIHKGFRSWRYYRYNEDGIDVWRCPLFVPSRPSGAMRIFHLLTFAAASLPVLLWLTAWRPELVFVVEPPLICAPQSLLLAKLCRARSWLHVQDFEFDAAVHLGLITAGPFRSAIAALERAVMRQFDHVSTISRAMMDRLGEKGTPFSRKFLLPNWADIRMNYPDRAAGARVRQDLRIPDDAVVILYCGNIGEKQGLELLIDVAKLLEKSGRIRFLICGEGGAKARIVSRAAGLRNIKFLPLQPAERYNALLNAADIHVVPQRSDAADLVMPSKITGILASGGALIATANLDTEVGRVVVAAGGILCGPGDSNALANAIAALADDAERRCRMGLNARRFAEMHLERDTILGAFEREILAMR